GDPERAAERVGMFEQQHPRAAPRREDRRRQSGRTAAGDDQVPALSIPALRLRHASLPNVLSLYQISYSPWNQARVSGRTRMAAIGRTVAALWCTILAIPVLAAETPAGPSCPPPGT